MAKLSTLIVPAALAALAVSATPAMASSAIHRPASHHINYGPAAHYVNHGQVVSLQRDISRLGKRIDRSLNRRAISRREANTLRRDVRTLQRQFTQFQRRGLTRAEARAVEVRIAQLSRALQVDRRDGNWRRG